MDLTRRTFLKASVSAAIGAFLSDLYADDAGFTLSDLKPHLSSYTVSDQYENVLVDNKPYHAHTITRKNYNPDTPEDAYRQSNYLITTFDGSVVTDRETYTKAAFTARIAANEKTLRVQLRKDIDQYTATIENVKAGHITTDITKSTLSTLPAAPAGPVATAAQIAVTTTKYGLETFINHTKQLSDITDSSSLQTVMVKIAENGIRDLKDAESLLPKVNTFSEASDFAEKIQSGYTGFFTSIPSLETYYNANENFLLDEVVHPLLEGVDHLRIVTTALQALYSTHAQAMREYTDRVGKISQTFTTLYGFKPYQTATQHLMDDVFNNTMTNIFPPKDPELTPAEKLVQDIVNNPQDHLDILISGYHPTFVAPNPATFNPEMYWTARKIMKTLSPVSPRAKEADLFFSQNYDHRFKH